MIIQINFAFPVRVRTSLGAAIFIVTVLSNIELDRWDQLIVKPLGVIFFTIGKVDSCESLTIK